LLAAAWLDGYKHVECSAAHVHAVMPTTFRCWLCSAIAYATSVPC
jgi:hypothetical protein